MSSLSHEQKTLAKALKESGVSERKIALRLGVSMGKIRWFLHPGMNDAYKARLKARDPEGYKARNRKYYLAQKARGAIRSRVKCQECGISFYADTCRERGRWIKLGCFVCNDCLGEGE